MRLWPFGAVRHQTLTPQEVAKERRLRLTDGSGWGFIFGRESNAGQRVDLQSTLQLATACACIRLTATAVASLPATVFEKGEDGSRTARPDHELAAVLIDSPNAGQTALEFWETMVAGVVARGNSCAE